MAAITLNNAINFNRRVTRLAFNRATPFTEGLPPCSATAGYVMRAKLFNYIKFIERITNPPYNPAPICQGAGWVERSETRHSKQTSWVLRCSTQPTA